MIGYGRLVGITFVAALTALTFSGCKPSGENGKSSLKQSIKEMLHGGKNQDREAKLRNKKAKEKRAKPKKPKVTLYTTKECAPCKQLEAILRENKISFRKVDVEKSSRGREFYAEAGGGALPIVTLDKEIVRGYQPDQVLSIYSRKMAPEQERQDSYRF